MTETGSGRQGVVVGVDGSDAAHQALQWAVRQVADGAGPLTLLHAVGPATLDWSDEVIGDADKIKAAREEHGRAVLEQARTQAADAGYTGEITESLSDDDPRAALLDASQTAALVVVGSRGRGPLKSLLLGSVSVAVARHASCPVVVYRPGPRRAERRGILVAADARPGAEPMLEFAFGQAQTLGLPLTVMHCHWDFEMLPGAKGDAAAATRDRDRDALMATLREMADRHPDVEASTTIVEGSPAAKLAQAADDMDLLVVGSRPHDAAWLLLFGSVSASVVEHAHSPVAVVPLGS